ncbi:MAG: hypothetical protein HC877_23570 [Thioploca sp.]|nr:hypothetical protein [Thioploca sp.]
MGSVDKLFKLADRLARKISLGQQVAGDFQDTLQSAGLWDKSAEVSPMLAAAGVDDGPVAITIRFDKGLNVKFLVSATPPAAAAKLTALLAAKYAAAMKAACVAAKLTVTDTMDVKWLTF